MNEEEVRRTSPPFVAQVVFHKIRGSPFKLPVKYLVLLGCPIKILFDRITTFTLFVESLQKNIDERVIRMYNKRGS